MRPVSPSLAKLALNQHNQCSQLKDTQRGVKLFFKSGDAEITTIFRYSISKYVSI